MLMLMTFPSTSVYYSNKHHSFIKTPLPHIFFIHWALKHSIHILRCTPPPSNSTQKQRIPVIDSSFLQLQHFAGNFRIICYWKHPVNTATIPLTSVTTIRSVTIRRTTKFNFSFKSSNRIAFLLNNEQSEYKRKAKSNALFSCRSSRSSTYN